ncbi:MAG: hypothetical protein NVSMB33_04460 [Ktedonobacteraceae bacterium]
MNDLKQDACKVIEQQETLEKNEDTYFSPIDQNIETIANLHRHMESDINEHQRAIETISAFLGRPLFLYFILLFVILWIVANILLINIGIRGFDPVPFTWLIEIINLASLLMTTVVLITQNRQSRHTEQRRRLDLQVNLLVEQKVTKIIDLLEQIRHDSPNLKERHDPEVDALKSSVDPHEVLSTLNQRLKELPEKED